MWPLAASGGWPLARGQLHSDLVNARRMRPYMPGAVGEGGLMRGGLLHIQEPGTYRGHHQFEGPPTI